MHLVYLKALYKCPYLGLLFIRTIRRLTKLSGNISKGRSTLAVFTDLVHGPSTLPVNTGIVWIDP